MDENNKRFWKWIALFVALLYIPAMVLYLSYRDVDDYVDRYAEQYAREHAVSASDAPQEAVSQTDAPVIHDYIVD